MDVKPERTHWRDLRLNDRHRRWGWDCPAIDIDCLFVEYDKGYPSALIEYKHENAPVQYASHPSYQALIHLANAAKIPMLAVRYTNDFQFWTVTPLNDNAKAFVPSKTQLTEKEFVTLLYQIRGYNVPDNILNGLDIEI